MKNSMLNIQIQIPMALFNLHKETKEIKTGNMLKQFSIFRFPAGTVIRIFHVQIRLI